jgi:C6 transcription factor Pro1
MNFFTGVITWYDVLSCASTGLAPFSNVSVIDRRVSPQIHFDKIMGCDNAVMRLILEIATLGEWKSLSEANGALDTWELRHRAADIEERLRKSVVTDSEIIDGYMTINVSRINTNTSLVTRNSAVKIVTRIFASAAYVYLSVITSEPYPNTPEIREGVSRTMAALDELEDKDLVQNLLWPVCIAGCMSMPEHETYWRELVSNVSGERWSFGYPSKVLEIMEECWALRKASSNTGTVVAMNWLTAMRRRDMRILLV